MLAPKGAGFLYVRRAIQDLIQPMVVSWGNNPTLDFTTGSRLIDILQWTGTKDPAAALTVPTVIQFMQDHHWEPVRRRCHHLLRQVIERICDLTGLPPLYWLDSDFYGQIGIAPLLNSDLAILKSRLYDEYQIEVPLTQWQDRQFLRISIPGYNTQEDVEALLAALKVLLPQVNLA